MTDAKTVSEVAAARDTSSASAPRPAATWSRYAWLVLPVVGCVAGALGSEVIQQTRELFQIAPERLGMPPHPPAIEREMLYLALASKAIGFGSLGLLICGSLGLAFGAATGSTGAAVRALLAGCVLGAICGAGGGMAALLVYDALASIALDGLFKAMLIHLPNWLLLAIATAVAGELAFGRKKLQPLLTSLSTAAIVSALLFPIASLIFFPAEAPDRPIPYEVGLRLLCFALGGAVLGLGASQSLRSFMLDTSKKA